ncbi:MAG TPA: aminotransferase DegT [Flavobacteriales bacterium]|nr:aminotransferase DegT [Flavobacteriales bacterium]
MEDELFVTKTFLPDINEYVSLVEEIWKSERITNHGPKCLDLESKLQKHLDVKHLKLVSNGTIAIQMAIKALELQGEIITTPFSYVATVSTIVWEGCKPVFVDIDKNDLCIDSNLIEAAITEDTSAILATHVYGNPCNVEKIQAIADKHGLKVIYDAAHAFGVEIEGKSILNYGDISTLSFHATKVFHSGEGGAVVCNNPELAHRLSYLRNFGHNGEENFWGLGINAKVSELHAAMGLCVLPQIEKIIAWRRQAVCQYDQLLFEENQIQRIYSTTVSQHNYSYYPLVFESETKLLAVRDALNAKKISPRRYFYPTLNKLPYLVSPEPCPIAESISRRVLCLPLSTEITAAQIDNVCSIILKTLQND